jgi:hypothetical protein
MAKDLKAEIRKVERENKVKDKGWRNALLLD